MSDKFFVDRNVLIEVDDLDAGGKRTIASDLLRGLWLDGTGARQVVCSSPFRRGGSG